MADTEPVEPEPKVIVREPEWTVLDKDYPPRYDILARYNSERSRGIMHTPEWKAKMAAVQADFDQCQRDGKLPLADWEYDFLMEKGS